MFSILFFGGDTCIICKKNNFQKRGPILNLQKRFVQLKLLVFILKSYHYNDFTLVYSSPVIKTNVFDSKL